MRVGRRARCGPGPGPLLQCPRHRYRCKPLSLEKRKKKESAQPRATAGIRTVVSRKKLVRKTRASVQCILSTALVVLFTHWGIKIKLSISKSTPPTSKRRLAPPRLPASANPGSGPPPGTQAAGRGRDLHLRPPPLPRPAHSGAFAAVAAPPAPPDGLGRALGEGGAGGDGALGRETESAPRDDVAGLPGAWQGRGQWACWRAGCGGGAGLRRLLRAVRRLRALADPGSGGRRR